MKSRSVMFYDAVCPTPYTLDSLTKPGIGGTEATVLRVAEALEGVEHSIVIAQRNRTELELKGIENTLIYTPLDYMNTTPDTVVTLRDAGHYFTNKAKYPKAKHYLWLHDVVSGDYRAHLYHHLEGKEANIICVSEWHKHQAVDALRPILTTGKIRFQVIYNPLAEYCTKEPVTIDNKKLVFFSSPHKGLDYVIKLFGYLRNVDPEFRLYLANPGYYHSATTQEEGIINLGALPHKEIIEHVRTALCTFYPQMSFAETFGLVLAESNAVGTPVMSHGQGAAPEVLDRRQIFDCRDYKKVVDTVIKWSKGERPIVSINKAFSTQEVIKQWKRIL